MPFKKLCMPALSFHRQRSTAVRVLCLRGASIPLEWRVKGCAGCCADSWAGVDRAVPFKLRVAEQSRASREGRVAAKPKEEAEAPEDTEDRDPDEEEEDEEDEGVPPEETSGLAGAHAQQAAATSLAKIAPKSGELSEKLAITVLGLMP